MTLTLTSLDGANAYTTSHVEDCRSLGLPERDAETIHVAGRNGDVLLDHGCYKNEKVQYDLYAFKLEELYSLADFLATQQNYVLIQDTDATWRRIGRLAGAVPLEQVIRQKLLRFTLTFDCKPQKYADYNAAIAGVSGVSLTPPALYSNSEPRIKLTGTGSVAIAVPQGDITVPGLTQGFVIDTGLLLAYKTAANGTRTAVDVPFFPAFTGAANTYVSVSRDQGAYRINGYTMLDISSSGNLYFADGFAHIVLWQRLTLCRALRVQLECYNASGDFIARTRISEPILFHKSLADSLDEIDEVPEQPGVIAQLLAAMHTHGNKTVLDELGELAGALTYKGESVRAAPLTNIEIEALLQQAMLNN
jgi:phage-related protein